MSAIRMIKEGFLMFYDFPQGQWTRLYVQLSTKSLELMEKGGSRFARSCPTRPSILTTSIAEVYCSADLPSAPERHTPIIAIRQQNGVLAVLRAAEMKTASLWCAALAEALPAAKMSTVQELSAFRGHFPIHLYASLFRVEEEKTTIAKRLPDVPTVGEVRRRIASVSADVPRRGPMRRGPLIALVNATEKHLDPTQPSAVVASSVATEKPSPMPPRPSRVRVVNVHSPPKENPPEKLCFEADASCMCSPPKREPTPPPAPIDGPCDEGKGHQEIESAAVKPKPRLADLVSPLPSADRETRVKEMRTEMEALVARNVDLELDNANMSCRILELEGEVGSLRAGLAEWKRKYKSLEGQLQVQEEDFAQRIEGEKQMLVSNMEVEVKAQLEAMRCRWQEKEREYLARIEEMASTAAVAA